MANYMDLEDRYRLEMARFVLPAKVVATKATAKSAEVTGSQRSIHHDHWIVRLGNPDELIKTDFTISFDPVIDFDGRRLNDPEARADYAVKKIMVLSGLDGLHGFSYASRDHCLAESRHYDWFIRWRRSLPIYSNDQLAPNHFEHFVDKLKTGEALQFIPISARIETLFSQLECGDISSAMFLRRRLIGRKIRETLDWEALSEKLGITALPLSRSAEFKMMLIDGFSQLPDDDSQRIASYIRPTESRSEEIFAPQTVNHHLRTWTRIYTLGSTGAITWNTFGFDPFRKKSVKKTTREITQRVPTRTRTIMPDDFFRLTRECSRWLLENHEYIELAVRLLREAGKIESVYSHRRRTMQQYLDDKRPAGAPRLFFGWFPYVLAKEPDGSQRISIGFAAKLLVSASMLTIGCYSPRRGNEIGQLRIGCIEKTESGPVLHAYIEKTEQGIRGVPVPETVALAVAVVERLGVRDDSDPDSQWLFKIKKADGFLEMKVSANIKEFLDYIELPPPTGATSWNFASHQLRRGHAIFFYYGNEWSDLHDVGRALHHFDTEMTRIYLTEIVPGEIARLEDELAARRLVARTSEGD